MAGLGSKERVVYSPQNWPGGGREIIIGVRGRLQWLPPERKIGGGKGNNRSLSCGELVPGGEGDSSLS